MKPRTRVDDAADAIVEAAAEGELLPGDRLVEADIARQLHISRVPVREALRLLESQGIVAATPYKGMRLMAVTNAVAIGITKVRAALELLAVRECCHGATEAQFEELRVAAAAFRAAGEAEDHSAARRQDRAFHETLVRATGNRTLIETWGAISRQTAVLWSLLHNDRPLAHIADDHDAVLDAMLRRDAAAAEAALQTHVFRAVQMDFEAELAARLRARGR